MGGGWGGRGRWTPLSALCCQEEDTTGCNGWLYQCPLVVIPNVRMCKSMGGCQERTLTLGSDSPVKCSWLIMIDINLQPYQKYLPSHDVIHLLGQSVNGTKKSRQCMMVTVSVASASSQSSYHWPRHPQPPSPGAGSGTELLAGTSPPTVPPAGCPMGEGNRVANVTLFTFTKMPGPHGHTAWAVIG